MRESQTLQQLQFLLRQRLHIMQQAWESLCVSRDNWRSTFQGATRGPAASTISKGVRNSVSSLPYTSKFPKQVLRIPLGRCNSLIAQCYPHLFSHFHRQLHRFSSPAMHYSGCSNMSSEKPFRSGKLQLRISTVSSICFLKKFALPPPTLSSLYMYILQRRPSTRCSHK
jgi:hypothetical protein